MREGPHVDRELLGGAGDASRGRHLLRDVLHGHGRGDDLPGELDERVALGPGKGPAPPGVHVRLEQRQGSSLTCLREPTREAGQLTAMDHGSQSCQFAKAAVAGQGSEDHCGRGGGGSVRSKTLTTAVLKALRGSVSNRRTLDTLGVVVLPLMFMLLLEPLVM